jgi:anti-anti-sigma factor
MPHITPTLTPPAALKLHLISIDRDGIIRVAVDGAITHDDVLGETNPLASLLGETWSHNRVILSLERANFIDSAGIGWLISTHKHFKAQGGAFVVHGIRPQVRQVLDLLKVGKVVSFADDEEAARTLAKGQ